MVQAWYDVLSVENWSCLIFMIVLCVNLTSGLNISASSFKATEWRKALQRAHMLSCGRFFEVALQHFVRDLIGQNSVTWNFDRKNFFLQKRENRYWLTVFPCTTLFIKTFKMFVFFDLKFFLKKLWIKVYKMEQIAIFNEMNLSR